VASRVSRFGEAFSRSVSTHDRCSVQAGKVDPEAATALEELAESAKLVATVAARRAKEVRRQL
jgi:hypothetical protein